MEKDAATLLEQLVPTPDEAGSLTQEQGDAIDLAVWLANALWQVKECGSNGEPQEIPVGLIPERIVEQALPLLEKKGWKATLHRATMPGDGSHVELTRA